MKYTQADLFKQVILATCWYKHVSYDEELNVATISDSNNQVIVTIFPHENWIELESVSGYEVELFCEHFYRKGILKKIEQHINYLFDVEGYHKIVDDCNEIVIKRG